MSKFSKIHDEFMYKSAKWIKAHRKQYCPITAVKHISRWKTVFKDLTKWGLVQPYKSGETIILTPDGWEWIAAKYPELASRHK